MTIDYGILQSELGKQYKLTTLETRRVRGDQDNVNYTHLFELNPPITRGHDLKLEKKFNRTNSRKFAFSQRIINDWNYLPSAVVHAKNINTFKKETFFSKIIRTIFNKRAHAYYKFKKERTNYKHI